MIGRGVQVKFSAVQFLASQEAVGKLGKISLQLQKELTPHAAKVDWERLSEEGYGTSVKVCVTQALGQWICDYIVPADQEFSMVFFRE